MISTYQNLSHAVQDLIIFTDIINYSVILILIFSLIYIKNLNHHIATALVLTSAVPFAMPILIALVKVDMTDQAAYPLAVRFLRLSLWDVKEFWTAMITDEARTSFEYSRFEVFEGKNFGEVRIREIFQFQRVPIAYLYSIIPLPFSESQISFALLNKFLFVMLIGYLIHKKALTNNLALIFILLPSCIIWTSVALRDTLVLSVMCLIVLFLIEHKLILTFFFLLVLALIKTQNFYMMSVITLFYVAFFYNRENIYRRYFVYFVILFAFIIFSSNFDKILEYFNEVRKAFYSFDHPLEPEGFKELVININMLPEIIFRGFVFYFNPAIWKADTVAKMLISLESLFFLLYTYSIYKNSNKKGKNIVIFWVVSLFFCLSIYGLLVENVGTAARWKFPFILTFILAISYNINKDKRKNKI